MKKEDILSKVDHTLLRPDTRFTEIKTLCLQVIRNKMATACIPPCYVQPAKERFGDNVRICTVVGFPNGNCHTIMKVFEAEIALTNGADELDVMINVGMFKMRKYWYVAREIEQIKKLCKNTTLKVIVETCLLTEEEKIKVCKIVSESGADYIKTSTGFSTGGATIEDIRLFRENLPPEVKIKASGGIKTLEDAEKFINAGADRIGASKIIQNLDKK